MGKAKKKDTYEVAEHKLQRIKEAFFFVKRKEDSEFKNTPADKVDIINASKVQDRYMPSQKGSISKNHKETLQRKQISNNNVKQSKQDSPITQEDVSLNITDETSVEDSDIDVSDIFGKSLGDETDEDDEDFEEDDKDDENEDEQEDDDDDVSNKDESNMKNNNAVKESTNKKAATALVNIYTKRVQEFLTQAKDYVKRVVLISNISKKTSEEEIKAIVLQYGPYEDINIYYLYDMCFNERKDEKTDVKIHPDIFTRFAIIIYKKKKSALNCEKLLGGYKRFGHRWTVMTLNQSVQDPLNENTVFFIHVKPMKDDHIWNMFEKCGKIRHIRQKLPGRYTRWASIHFETADAARAAFNLNGIQIEGHPIKVLRFGDFLRLFRKLHLHEDTQGTKRILSLKDDKPPKKFKNSSEEPVAYNTEFGKNIEEQEVKEKKSTAFQDQKIELKNKKKKLDKKKKKMAEKLTAKSAKV